MKYIGIGLVYVWRFTRLRTTAPPTDFGTARPRRGSAGSMSTGLPSSDLGNQYRTRKRVDADRPLR